MSGATALQKLYLCLCAAFCVIVVVANIISVKMVHVPYPVDLSFPVGLLFYPLTFLIGDLVTEIYGAKKAKLIVYIALGMNLLSLGMIQIALALPAASWQEESAFQDVLGLGNIRIMASLIAYLVAQIAGIQLFALIKSRTGERFLWLRNNASACVAQILDTVIVDLIYLYWGLGMPAEVVGQIILFSYVFKVFFSLANTPLFYLCVYLIRQASWGSTSQLLARDEITMAHPTQAFIID